MAKPGRTKITRRELELRLQDVLKHNEEMGVFCATLIETVKLCHKEACDGYDSLHLAISPTDRKNRKRFKEMATMMGPFCIEIGAKGEPDGDQAESGGKADQRPLESGGSDDGKASAAPAVGKAD